MSLDINRKFFELGFDVTRHTNAILGYWDKDLICRFASDAYKDWFGIDPLDMIGKMSLEELLGPLYEQNLPHVKNVFEGKVQVFERQIKRYNGEIKNSIVTYCPDFQNGEVNGFYVHIADISNLNQTNKVYNEELSIPTGKFIIHNDPIEDVRKALQQNLFTGFPGISALAKNYFISESKLKKDFKARYNRSVFAYYRFLQMELAHSYLNEKKCSKKQISVLLNFTNTSNFLICYKKYTNEKSSHELVEEINKVNDDRYKTFIAQAPFAIAMLDNQLVFKAVSQKFVDDYQLVGKPLIGFGFYHIFSKIEDKLIKIHQAALNGKANNGEEVFFERENGSRIWLRWDVRPWRTHEGKIGGILIFTEDITSLKIKEEENHEVLEILNKANELIKIGVWKKNFKNNTVTWDQVMRDILEVPKNYKECSEFALEFYKPGKNKKVVEQAFADAINLGKSFDLKAEIITYKGNLKVIRVVGYSEFRNGECERLFGIIQDITKK